MTKRPKPSSIKEPQQDASIAAPVEVIKPIRHLAHQVGGSRGLLFSNNFTLFVLPCGFTPTDEFVLWQLLNHDIMNKLSQLSVSVVLPFRWHVYICFHICYPRFPYNQSGMPPMFSG
jgi:hypothetical protein